MTSISLRFHNNFYNNLVAREDDEKNKISRDLVDYKEWLAKYSCTVYHSVEYGNINPLIHPEKVDYMFRKKIKLFICNLFRFAFLVTEDGEQYYWKEVGQSFREEIENNEDECLEELFYIHYLPHKFDWCHTRIVQTATNTCNFLALTDDGKLYYHNTTNRKESIHHSGWIHQMDIKEKIIYLACSSHAYIVATDNGKIYTWGSNYNGRLCISTCTKKLVEEACEMVDLSGKTIVKIVCGYSHTLALTAKGKVYAWGANELRQSNFNSEDNVCSSPIMVNISNVREVSDIAAIRNMSAVKSSKDGLVYIWGKLSDIQIKKSAVCEYTNIFDVCNSLHTQPIDMYTDEQISILNDLEAAFNDNSTSDFTIEVEEQPIYVHKAILQIRSLHFRTMFQPNWIENNKSVITLYNRSYVIYETFLKYLYTGTINLSSLHDKLELLKLADEYGEENLERDCIRTIKIEVTVSNVFYIDEIAHKYNKKDLEEYCFNFYLKNIKSMICTESFARLDLAAKSRLTMKEMTRFKHNTFQT